MKIDANKVLNERKLRAWSQQHLADVTALSLRTIQRVEKEGVSSLETVRALAACFELDANDLLVLECTRNNSFDKNIKAKPFAMWSSVIALIVSIPLLFVQPLMALDFEISADTISISDENKYQLYRGNVEIFIPEGITFEVESDEYWGTDAASVVAGSVKVELERGTLMVGDGVVIKDEKGITITTDYAELRLSPIQ